MPWGRSLYLSLSYWRIYGRLPCPLLIWGQTEVRRVEKNYFGAWSPSFLRAWTESHYRVQSGVWAPDPMTIFGVCLVSGLLRLFSFGVSLFGSEWGGVSLVPRRSLLPRCPREVSERAGGSRRVSLGDVTAHGRVQDWLSLERLGTRLRRSNTRGSLAVNREKRYLPSSQEQHSSF